MSGKCEKCNKHCLDCECKNPKSVLQLVDEITGKSNAYHYLGLKDKHIIDLFHWIEILNNLFEEVRQTEMNHELEEEIENIITKLTHEVGVRVVSLFP